MNILCYHLLYVSCLMPWAVVAMPQGQPSLFTTTAKANNGRFIGWQERRIDDEGLSGISLRGADGLAIADLDLDGYVDVVSVHEDSGHLRICFGSLSPNQWTRMTLAEDQYVGGCEDVRIADMNGDTRLDVVVASEDPGALTVYFSPELPFIREPARWDRTVVCESRGSWIRVDVADIDRDGKNDILGANKGGTSFSVFHTGGKDPLVDDSWQETQLQRGEVPRQIVASDIDADGDLDVLIGGKYPEATLLLNIGKAFEFDRVTLGGGLFSLALADMDGDKKLDIVTHRRILIQPANPRDEWKKVAYGRADPDAMIGFGVTDINGDNYPDIICGGYSASPRLQEPESPVPEDRSGHISWYEHPGKVDGEWARHTITRRRRGMFDAFIPYDVNRDGLIDFIYTRGNSGDFDGTYWLEQVRSDSPQAAFHAAREHDSRELPWPNGSE